MTCPFCGSHNATGAAVCDACGAGLASDSVATSGLAVETALMGGVYRIERVLGQGGFGITYLGRDTNLHRAVAIKEFFPQGCLRQDGIVQPTGAVAQAGYTVAKQRFLEE